MTIFAMWNGTVIAQSDDTVIVEGNHYFPKEDVVADLLVPTKTSTHCPWKGDASYYSLEVGGELNEDAAWYYQEPKSAASQIKNRIAFWKGVEILEK